MPFLAHLHDFISTYGYFAVFVIVGLESAGVPMPGETALVSAAIFAGQGALDIKWVIACAAAGAILGDNAGYWVGREFGFPIVLEIRPLSPPRRAAAEARPIFVSAPWRQDRLLRPLRRRAARLRGAAGGHQPAGMAALLPVQRAGGIVWASIFGLGGFFLGHAFEHYAKPVGIAALICAIVGAVAASRFISHHEQRLMAEAEAALPGPLVAPRDRGGA